MKSIYLTAAAAAAIETGIHKKILTSGHSLDLAQQAATWVMSNEEMRDIIKIVKSLEDSSLLTKGVTQTIENERK